MKIFYAVQATGNGHISRAVELLPFFQQYGEVDIFLSGSNATLPTTLPVKYKSAGVSFFYRKNGGLDYWLTAKKLAPLRAWKEAKELPVEKYDIVINDFESITSLACRIKKVKSINFGHQASFQSKNTPRPAKKDFIGELVLKHYATATSYVGLHFQQYDDFIYNPVIKDEILKADVKEEGHITIYLPHYSDENVLKCLRSLKGSIGLRFEVFSKIVKEAVADGNVSFIPVNNSAFNKSMATSYGVITGAGFETPAEALYMGKKVMCFPIKGQYEQYCNAAALKHFNVPVIDSLDETFASEFDNWMNNKNIQPLKLSHSTEQIVEVVMKKAMK